MTTHALARTPIELGAPTYFPAWYKGQEDALEYALYSDKRHVGMGLATGSGKSLVAYLIAKIRNEYANKGRGEGRTVILTHRKGLTNQYKQLFPGVQEIRGWRNYESMDAYVEELKVANAADIVVTNYAYWLSAQNFGTGIGPMDTIICDEAGMTFRELTNFMSLTITEKDCQEYHIDWPDSLTDNPIEWASWAATEALPALSKVEGFQDEELEHIQILTSRLRMLTQMSGDWVADRQDRSVYLAKVWPGEEANNYLFKNASKIVHLSATLRPKTLDHLGLTADDYDFKEWPHPYPSHIRPIYWIPTIRAIERGGNADWASWVNRLDQLCDRWPDDLGVVHTVSYKRAQMYMEQSYHRNQGILTTHYPKNTEEAVEDFRMWAGRKVLVSPVLVAGWDLPEVRWQAIGKLPWPDSRGPLAQERKKIDPDFAAFEVAQDLVQTCGRIVRGPNESDAGDTYIIDDSWAWFGPKYRSFMPEWFYVEKSNSIPRH